MTDLVPSKNGSSSTVSGNVAEVWPAGIVTVGGTETFAADFEERFRTRLACGAVETDTLPEMIPAPSVACAGSVSVSVLGGAAAVMAMSSMTMPSVVSVKSSY